MKPGERPRKPPTVELVPGGDDYRAGLEALRIAELAGLDLDDWQQFVLLEALCKRDGVWAAFEVALVIARQNGKSEILIAVILWALFTELDDPRLVIFAAHEYKTAREIFLRLRFLLDPAPGSDPLLHADPGLLEQIRTIRTANGEESVELVNGRRVRFLARTSGSGRGFTGDIVLLDEAYKLSQDQMAALLPTMGARPNPQIWYSSMGPFEDSEVQLALMERARSDDTGRLCYLGWQAPIDVDPGDHDMWLTCNPAHPHRMTLETLENEYKALGPDGFAREKLCMTVSSFERVLSPLVWESAKDATAAPVGELVFAVDVNPERSHAAVAVSDPTGRCELVEGGYEKLVLSDVADRVIGLCRTHDAPIAVDVNGPAGPLVAHFEAAELEIIRYQSRELTNAASRFFDLIHDGHLKIRPHEALDTAVGGAVKRIISDSWAWGRMKSTVDICPLVALTLAVDAAVKPEYEDPGLVVYSLDDY